MWWMMTFNFHVTLTVYLFVVHITSLLGNMEFWNSLGWYWLINSGTVTEAVMRDFLPLLALLSSPTPSYRILLDFVIADLTWQSCCGWYCYPDATSWAFNPQTVLVTCVYVWPQGWSLLNDRDNNIQKMEICPPILCLQQKPWLKFKNMDSS